MTELEKAWAKICSYCGEATEYPMKELHIVADELSKSKKFEEAIEKQIPKRKHKYQGYRCVCGKEVAKNQRYCEYCGQALLDYEEVNK